jgi:hypothetical protein
MQAIRHGTMLPSLQRNEIGTSELDPFIAVEMAIADYPPHIYGPAARCKWNLRMGMRSASIYPASGWSLRPPAIMGIRAQRSSLDPRPRRPCAGPGLSCAGRPLFHRLLPLANLGGISITFCLAVTTVMGP